MTGLMNTQGPRCVLLADRHHRLMEGVRGLLETVFEVVVMVADETSLSEAAERLRAPLVIVDFSLAPGTGLDLVRRLRGRFPALKLIVIGVHDDARICQLVIDAGASAYVLKREIATELLAAV